MTSLSVDQQQVFETIREIVSQETNHTREEIALDSHLEDDLSIELNEDNGQIFGRIINRINREYEINLEPGLFLEEDYENQTLGLLVDLVIDEINLQ